MKLNCSQNELQNILNSQTDNNDFFIENLSKSKKYFIYDNDYAIDNTNSRSSSINSSESYNIFSEKLSKRKIPKIKKESKNDTLSIDLNKYYTQQEQFNLNMEFGFQSIDRPSSRFFINSSMDECKENHESSYNGLKFEKNRQKKIQTDLQIVNDNILKKLKSKNVKKTNIFQIQNLNKVDENNQNEFFIQEISNDNIQSNEYDYCSNRKNNEKEYLFNTAKKSFSNHRWEIFIKKKCLSSDLNINRKNLSRNKNNHIYLKKSKSFLKCLSKISLEP